MRNKPAFTDAQWKLFTAEVKSLVKNSAVPLAGWDGKGKPEFNATRVAFNGLSKYGDDHETAAVAKKAVEFSFCKTAGKPYDQAVVQLYTLARKYLPETKLSSDGGDVIFG